MTLTALCGALACACLGLCALGVAALLRQLQQEQDRQGQQLRQQVVALQRQGAELRQHRLQVALHVRALCTEIARCAPEASLLRVSEVVDVHSVRLGQQAQHLKELALQHQEVVALLEGRAVLVRPAGKAVN